MCNHEGYYAPNMLRKKEFAGVTERTSAKTLVCRLLKSEEACVSINKKQAIFAIVVMNVPTIL